MTSRHGPASHLWSLAWNHFPIPEICGTGIYDFMRFYTLENFRIWLLLIPAVYIPFFLHCYPNKIITFLCSDCLEHSDITLIRQALYMWVWALFTCKYCIIVQLVMAKLRQCNVTLLPVTVHCFTTWFVGKLSKMLFYDKYGGRPYHFKPQKSQRSTQSVTSPFGAVAQSLIYWNGAMVTST